MSDLTELAKLVFLETLRAVDPVSKVKEKLRIEDGNLNADGELIPLSRFREVVLLGMGKASMTMGAAVESLLGNRITRGILATNHRLDIDVKSKVIVSGHPLPDHESLRAAEMMIELARSSGPDTLLIFVISGGGSSLVELPFSPDISLKDLQITNQLLISCGASIQEINVVRKNLSRIKGGRLGHLARTARRVGLYISDVNPGDICSIASNPLLPEASTASTFLEVVEKYKLSRSLPRPVLQAVDQRELFIRSDEASPKDEEALLRPEQIQLP